MKSLLLLVFVAVLGALVWVLFLGGKPRQYDMRVEVGPYPVGTEIYADGKLIGTFTENNRITFPAKTRPSRKPSPEVLPTFQLKEKSPCGKRESALAPLAPPTQAFFDRVSKDPTKTLTLAYREEDPPMGSDNDLRLRYDNRGQPAAVVAIGDLEMPIAADSKGELPLPFSSACPQGRQLKLNGKSLGELPADLVDLPEGEHTSMFSLNTPEEYRSPSREFFLDTSASRCYRYRELYFGRGAGSALGFAPPSRIAIKRKTLFQRLPGYMVEFYLEPVPERITVDRSEAQAMGMVTKAVFEEIPCS